MVEPEFSQGWARTTTEDSTVNPEAAMFIGIDVAKAELVIAARPNGECWTVANDERGVKTLLDRLTTDKPELIVLEATGGYELLGVAALAAST